MVTRPIKEAQEAADSARETVKNLCPWLPDPHQCGDCGAYCDATEGYVQEQAVVVDIWQCPNDECGQRYYRNRD
jgi:hypothetical protein